MLSKSRRLTKKSVDAYNKYFTSARKQDSVINTRQHAPTTAVADNDNQLPILDDEIEKLKADRDAFTSATQWYQTYVQNGGDPNADFIQSDERMIAYRQMVQQYGDLSKLEAELEDKQAAKWALENSSKYNYLQENADYEEKSSEVSENPTTKFGLQIGTKFIGAGDPVYDYINDIGGQRTQSKQTGGNAAMQKYRYMSEDEIANYNIQVKAKLHHYNQLPQTEKAEREAILRSLFGSLGKNPYIENTFQCDMGFNLHAGDNLYCNHNCVFLDFTISI